MLSSEVSGASARAVRAGEGNIIARLQGQASGNRKGLRIRLNPTTIAVAATAFLSATLFVAYDANMSLGQARKDMELVRALISAELDDVAPAQFTTALEAARQKHTAAGLPESLFTQATLSTTSVGVLPQGITPTATPEHAALAGVAGRGAAAFALAGLITAFGARRRRPDGLPSEDSRLGYEQLAASIPHGVACWTAGGKLIMCNEHYRQQTGALDPNLGYEQMLCEMVVGGYMKLVRIDDGGRLLELHRVDGSCLQVDERPMPDGGFMVLVSDITERKRTDDLLSSIREEQRLLARRYHEEKIKAEAASRAKTSFLAHLSHDIRTPLNHIIGFAELLRHETYGPLGDARYGEYVQSIKTSGEHLLTSFAAILDLAELEGGQKVLRNDLVAVDDVVATVARRYKGQLNRAGIKLSQGQPCGAMVRGDRLGFTRMVGNIVENAVRFTPRGGKITLASYAAEDGVVIEISDTGIGMDEERLHTLSQPFALGDATFTREGAGPGLGISISRAIAELSGGHMAIDSTLSMGTTVAISLPIETSTAQHVA
ncbi:PAS domain-containing sensor histidine kinase [Devosia sp. SD17-2]|jgi:two-component system cell cycle sensor histidine kinase PleC|uniref:sensor histidine kinase n=1 Tax=Devosia sp. SD17-2 TaxID=2976459 RepID=UPI0023D803C6|nr:PAS domain-containing sensor histidine kinase [Devosia sp. SD17-2]WEJ32343.1 ATP-binding protein [Devosia sp. SD17-2]